jgi:multicomponent Na+:H+ antiporter subunit G
MSIADAVLYVCGVMVLAGSVFALLAAIGVLRLPDVYTRMHAASKAGVVGAGLILLAAGLAAFDPALVLRAVLGIIFLLLTTPVSAHLLARAAITAGIRPVQAADTKDLDDLMATRPAE